jgi:prepilin-type processing-associated H-X9-DG protein
MIQNLDTGVGSPTDAPSPKKSGCWLYAIVGVGGVVLLIGLLLPATRSTREPARNAQCKNNLKQIMLAMHTYADHFGEFPPAYTVDADGKPLHSWRTLLLPWLEGAAFFPKLDLSKPWDDPVNAELFAQFIERGNPAAFSCPSADFPRGQTTYLAIVTPNSCLRPGKGRPLSDVKDGQSTTLIVIEVPDAHAVPWMAPVDADEKLVLSINSDRESRSPHPIGFNAAFCDGSVKFLLNDLSAADRRALISIDAGDKVKESD